MPVLVDSSSPTLSHPSPNLKDEKEIKSTLAFEGKTPQKQPAKLPSKFIWPCSDLAPTAERDLNEPLVDLGGFFRGDEAAISCSAQLIRAACLNHGLFQVSNHGVDLNLIQAAHEHMDAFFKLPIKMKVKARRKPGSFWGYSGGHADRYTDKLPWKETFSFGYHDNKGDGPQALVHYFKSVMGDSFEETGRVYQKYCEEMNRLSLAIMELLAISLGVDRSAYRDFFKDGSSIMRCNYYPPCKEPGLTLGTGPHCDPTSLAILHQDKVGGLQVFSNDKWQAVRPRTDALVVSIGDTFMALSNGKYKSCLHRALVDKDRERKSLVYFVCPKEDKVVRPQEDLVGPRKYPDFTWAQLLDFTQTHYRADVTTLQSFIYWHLSPKKAI